MLNQFNNTLDVWITALHFYSLKDLHKKPNGFSWSLGQVCMHIITETNFFLLQAEGCALHNQNSHESMMDTAKKMFENNEFPDEKIKTDPTVSENIPQPLSKADLLNQFDNLRLQVNRVWKGISLHAGTGKSPHPGLGYFSATEWFCFAEMHARHHLRQKKRLDEIITGKP